MVKTWIKHILGGDISSFSHLVKKYEKDIFYYFFRMTKNYDDSRDLSQETFLRAYKYLKTYNEKYAFSTWIFKIAHNCLNDFWKRKGKNDLSVERMEEEYHYEPSSDENVSETVERNDLKYQIKKALLSLPALYKEIMILRVIEEKSYEEICEITSISLSNVKIRIHRARKAMRKILEEYRKDEER